MTDTTTPIRNALSFDIEEYFHVHGFQDVIRPDDWDRFPARVVPATQRILHLLDAHDARATFFILGWVAERHPDLVKEIHDGGHEIASHGYAHQAVDQLTSHQLAQDLQHAGEAILAACHDAELQGYRAPSFSINQRTPWAFEELKQAGYRYDSSVSPATTHDRYGVRGAERFVHEAAFGLIEIPPSTIRLAGQCLPVVGGGHFRLAPLVFSQWAMRRIHHEGRPVVAYFHPWEFDPDQPRIRNAGWRAQFRHYLNISKTEQRLTRLLQTHQFGRIDEVFASALRDSLIRRSDSSTVRKRDQGAVSASPIPAVP